MDKTIQLQLVCTEGEAPGLSQRLLGEGGEVTGTDPFEPPPDEIDLHADAQFEPLTMVSALVTAALGMKLIREAIRDLRGGRVMVIDVSEDSVRKQTVDLGGASHVILKSKSGAETFEVTQTPAIEEALLKALGK